MNTVESSDSNAPTKRGIASRPMFLLMAIVLGVAVYFGARQLMYTVMLWGEQSKSTTPTDLQPLTKPLEIEEI